MTLGLFTSILGVLKRALCNNKKAPKIPFKRPLNRHPNGAYVAAALGSGGALGVEGAASRGTAQEGRTSLRSGAGEMPAAAVGRCRHGYP